MNTEYNIICKRVWLRKKYFLIAEGKICEISKKEFNQILKEEKRCM